VDRGGLSSRRSVCRSWLAALTHTLWVVFVGAALLLVGIYGWAFEPFEV